jgi:GTP-binding protein
VRARVEEAITTSDVLLFVLEYDRVTEWDERVARKLRKSGKPIIVVANKADNPKRDVESYTLLEL